MTFAQLKALRTELWPQGEAPELVIPHNKSFISALIDLQKRVECLQVNNTQVYEFCSTMFQCGMTVLNAPRGKINKVSTFARRDADCEEDAESDVQWCDEVVYQYLEYPRLTRLLDSTLRRACNSTLGALLTLDSGLCHKMLGDAYPAPTDADYVGYPELPQGFHYPQASTDSAKGRAICGVWALERGRIYLAPWLQSTEIVVIEWDGIKRDWADADLVEDGQDFINAVKLFVQREHARDWDKSTADFEIYDAEYRAAVAELIQSCDEESREQVRRPSKARMSQASLTDAVEICTSTTTDGDSTTSTTTAGEGGCVAQIVYYTSGTPDNPPDVNCPAIAVDPNGNLPTLPWNIVNQEWNVA